MQVGTKYAAPFSHLFLLPLLHFPPWTFRHCRVITKHVAKPRDVATSYGQTFRRLYWEPRLLHLEVQAHHGGDSKKLWHSAAKDCSLPTVKLPKTLVEEIKCGVCGALQRLSLPSTLFAACNKSHCEFISVTVVLQTSSTIQIYFHLPPFFFLLHILSFHFKEVID